MADTLQPLDPAATIAVRVNGQVIEVPPGTSVAAAVMRSGTWTLRTSIGKEPRGALCGMGICFECRVTIDGALHQRSCQTLCRAGMEITSDGA
jgi:predicted molibdopterin-dependent oxidoreductase YjgC